jgi:hypothetical protein
MRRNAYGLCLKLFCVFWHCHGFKADKHVISSGDSGLRTESGRIGMDAQEIQNLSALVESTKKGRRLDWEIIQSSSQRTSHHFQPYFWVLCTIWAHLQLLHCKDECLWVGSLEWCSPVWTWWSQHKANNPNQNFCEGKSHAFRHIFVLRGFYRSEGRPPLLARWNSESGLNVTDCVANCACVSAEAASPNLSRDVLNPRPPTTGFGVYIM